MHEYRAQAVKLVTEQGIGLTEAARKLALSVKTYSRWVRVASAPQRQFMASGFLSLSTVQIYGATS